MKILIAGDSFGAKWPDSTVGWPSLLCGVHSVKNVSEAGVGEYKILKQLKNQNIKKFDLVIVNHTSPYRVHTASPIHNTDLHANCDLIFSDVEALDQNDPKIKTAVNWFKYHYDEDFQEGIYKLIRKEIKEIITVPYLAIDHNKTSADFAFEDLRLDFSEFWPKNRGNINHYTIEGNLFVYKSILEKINEMGIGSR
jgi:hypothetical protein